MSMSSAPQIVPVPQPFSRPSLARLGIEPWRAAIEYAMLKWSMALHDANGDGHPVVVFPGLGTDKLSTTPIRDFCTMLGYNALDWGRGVNVGPRGDIDGWLRTLADETAERLAAYPARATLLGCTRGGLYARELAKLLGRRRVRQVITIGTPFSGDPDHTNVAWLYRLLNGSAPVVDPAFRERLRTPPRVPTTSIYSRSDGVVAWQACCHDRPFPRVQDIEVDSSHIGMGWNPAVFAIVANRLGQPERGWRPYRV